MYSSAPIAGYDGHAIFQNQPPYTIFNKSFEDPTDALFLSLNEIDPVYLQPEFLQDDYQFGKPQDPRTGKDVERTFYDHSCVKKPAIFASTTVSSLNRSQHNICLSLLLAWQNREEVCEEKVITWRRLERKRLNERQEFQKFVFDYARTNKETMYEPTKRLVEIYKNWYEGEISNVMKRVPDFAFNAHCGLPHVRVCNNLAEKKVVIANVKLVGRKGLIPIFNGTENEVNFQKFNHKLKALVRQGNEEFHEDVKKDFRLMANTLPDDTHTIFIPFESILFLLVAGDYPDSSTEMLVEMKSTPNGKGNIIEFEKPLPARNCGWHTHKKIVERAFTTFNLLHGDTKLLCVDNDKVHLNETTDAREIDASQHGTVEYKPIHFDEFLKTSTSTRSYKHSNTISPNCALLKWSLVDADCESSPYDFYTTMELPPTVNEECSTFLPSCSLKIEYKPELGCEIMTRYELIQIWLRWHLMSCFNCYEHAKCFRISAKGFELQVEENLTLESIEQQLADVYHVNMAHLLANLVEFLRLLSNVVPGKYILRYNPKFKDKLLLCAPTEEITKNTLFLYTLLKTEPSDLAFMTQQSFLPISDTLCSVLHRYHKILPCAFLPKSLCQKVPQDCTINSTKMWDDRKHLLYRLRQKTIQKEQENVKKQMASKKARKTKRNKLRKSERNKQRKAEEEFQKDMEADKLLYGF